VGMGAEESDSITIVSSVDIKRQTVQHSRLYLGCPYRMKRESNKGYGQSLWAQQHIHSQRFFPKGLWWGVQSPFLYHHQRS
jgi:hypothetical protein